MRKLALVALMAASVALVVGPRASADGCNDELVVNEASATQVAGSDTISIRVWEDLTCPPAGDGFGGPTDQGHLVVTVNDVTVCAVDGIDMGNDPFGFGSSVTIDETAPCGAQVSWSGFTGVFAPDASGPGLTKSAPATGTVWWEGDAGRVDVAVDDADATFSKRAGLV